MGGASNTPWGAIVQGAANVAGGILNRRASRKAQWRAYKMNLKQWNLQNEYNTPKMQMARLKAAGLNPNLAYGNGTVANTAKQQSPQLTQDLPPVQVPQMAGELQKFIDLKLKQKQGRLIDANVDRTIQETVNLGTKNIADAELVKGRKLSNKEKLELYPTRIAITKEKLATQKARTGSLQATAQQTRLKSKFQTTVNKLAQEGVFPGDPLWSRQMAKQASTLKGFLKESWEQFTREYENWQGMKKDRGRKYKRKSNKNWNSW